MIGLERPTNQIVQVSPGGPGSGPGLVPRPSTPINAVQWDNQRLEQARQEAEESAANAGVQDPAGEEDSTTISSSSGTGSEFSLSQLMMDHPEMSPEELLKEAAKYSDEYAEMYTSYMLENQREARDNAYNESREDTRYQRLVEDLKAAGLNPAMMYGSTASTSAIGASGYSSISEGAHSRDVKNYELLTALIEKLRDNYYKRLDRSTNTIWRIVDGLHSWKQDGINTIIKMLGLG